MKDKITPINNVTIPIINKIPDIARGKILFIKGECGLERAPELSGSSESITTALIIREP